MRIFHVAQATPNEIGLPSSRLWRANLFDPLVDLGHELLTLPATTPGIDWLSRGYCIDTLRAADADEVARRRGAFSDALVEAVRAAHRRRPIDLLFTYFASAHAEAGAIREIGRLGIATVNWYCNASYQFHLVSEIAPAYDACLVPERFRLDDYRRAGANPIYCQEAANPNVYFPRAAAEEFDVTFVGQRYGSRPATIRQLLGAGVDVRVWGPRWRESGDPAVRAIAGDALDDEALIAMYSRSRVSLGFAAVAGPSGIRQVRLRDFEAPMSGAFYLTEYCEELTEFFEPGREIVCYRDAGELVELARRYLGNDAARRTIRDAGLRRARAEHTWHRRFESAFRQMGLGRPRARTAAPKRQDATSEPEAKCPA